MDKRQELERADKERSELAYRRDQIRRHLRELDSNMALFRGLKAQYEANIRVLKNPNYITTVEGYKKVRDEFTSILGRLSAMQIDYDNNKILLERLEKSILAANEKYAILLQKQDAPVIRGNFGKK